MMAAYLSIRHKATGEVYNGRKLIEVYEMLSRAMGHEPDPVNWFEGWMNWAGFAIAVRGDMSIQNALIHHMTASDFGEPNETTVAVCEWLIANFENTSYHAH